MQVFINGKKYGIENLETRKFIPKSNFWGSTEDIKGSDLWRYSPNLSLIVFVCVYLEHV